jgi:ABC-2 type transport system permease protein
MERREPGSAVNAAYELKRQGLRPWLWLLLFVMRNWITSWAFFLPSFVLSLLQMFTGAAVFYLMGQLVAPGAAEHVEQYGTQYGTYIVIGLMFKRFMDATVGGFYEGFQHSYWASQTDVYLQHPGGLSALLSGDILMRYFMSIVHTLAYLAVGIWLFGVTVEVANLPDVVAILALVTLALMGLGLASASAFTLLNAKSGESPVGWLLGFAVTLLAGVYFPPTVLPAWLQSLADWLPHTHALHAARLCLSGKASLATPEIGAAAVFLVKFAALALPVGLLLYVAGMRKAQRDGSLSRWS